VPSGQAAAAAVERGEGPVVLVPRSPGDARPSARLVCATAGNGRYDAAYRRPR